MPSITSAGPPERPSVFMSANQRFCDDIEPSW
jgi:hypothetical protein